MLRSWPSADNGTSNRGLSKGFRKLFVTYCRDSRLRPGKAPILNHSVGTITMDLPTPPNAGVEFLNLIVAMSLITSFVAATLFVCHAGIN